MQGLILAAGRGERMRPLTDAVPKPLLPIDGVPAIVRVAELLASSGCRDLVVVVGYKAEAVRRLLGDGSSRGLRVSYVKQEPQRGSGDAVIRGMAGGTGPVLVLAADTILPETELAKVAERLMQREAEAVVAVGSPRPWCRDTKPVLVEDGRLKRVIDGSSPGGGPIVVPAYGLRPSILPYLARLEPGRSGVLQLADALQAMIDDGLPVAAVTVRGARHLTTPIDLLRENFPYIAPYLP